MPAIQQTPTMSSTPLSRISTNNHNTRTLHDKTSYSIMPTPPSPTNSSPSLTQSGSNSSNSPPQPTTPPQGRASSKGRYPSLGRVPLHRRGTSKTYERLEDLLREAGYKETRVFTPETERAEIEAEERNGVDNSKTNHRESMKGGVGVVVGFLAGLIPSRNSSRNRVEQANLASSPPRAYSPPTSPLAHKQNPKQSQISSTATPTTLSSSVESLNELRSRPHTPHSRSRTGTRPKHQHPHQSKQLSHLVSNTSLHTQQALLHRTSNSSLRYIQQTLPHPPPNPIAQPQPRPSRAGAYLRHMASAPNMPKRPNSTPSVNTNQQRGRQTLVLNDDEDEQQCHSQQPPLPPTWLESVARAVLFGGTGAHVGGPPANSNSAPPPTDSRNRARAHPPPPALRQTKSSLSQITYSSGSTAKPKSRAVGGQLDNANIRTITNLPPLFTRIGMERAAMSEGEVSRTRVICRSAPVSRAGSRERGNERERGTNHQGGATAYLMDWGLDGAGQDKVSGKGGKRKERGRSGRRGKKRVKERDGVPSLARTRVEGDLWSQGRSGAAASPDDGARTDMGNRYLSGWGAHADAEEEAEGDVDQVSSSSEEEGELDLARMLVPPKRQNSIRSLRKHLAGQGVGGVSAGVAVGGAGKMTGVPGTIVRAGKGLGVGRGSRTGSVNRWGRETDGEGDDGDIGREEWGRGWVRKRERGRRESLEEEEEGDGEGHGFAAFLRDGTGASRTSGTGASRSKKRRSGLPSAWAGWNGVGGS